MAKFPCHTSCILQVTVDIIYNVFIMYSMENMEYDFQYTSSGEERVAYGLKL